MAQVTIGRWGRNLAIRFPGEVVKAAGLRPGERLQIEARDDAIIVRRATPHFVLADLFRGRSAQEWRAAYRDAFDWAPDMGREVVGE